MLASLPAEVPKNKSGVLFSTEVINTLDVRIMLLEKKSGIWALYLIRPLQNINALLRSSVFYKDTFSIRIML